VGPIAADEYDRALRSASEFREVRFVSYNVWGLPNPLLRDRSRLGDIAQVLPELGADVIGIQETFTEHSHLLASLPDYPHAAWGPGSRFPRLSSGLLTISRWPIVDSATMTYSRCTGSDCMARKGALYTRIRIDGIGDVDVFNTHLDAGNDDSARMLQVRELAAFIARHRGPRPLVVLGDFNQQPHSAPYALLLQLVGGRDSHGVYVPRPEITDDPGFTFDASTNQHIHGTSSPGRIDHILYAGAAGEMASLFNTLVMTEIVGGRHLSDHFGVMAGFRIAACVDREAPLWVEPLLAEKVD
jgi:endonuclease/exonuclease/phosphatase family metal-dependent hydrolase